jgi:hypothetical protein
MTNKETLFLNHIIASTLNDLNWLREQGVLDQDDIAQVNLKLRQATISPDAVVKVEDQVAAVPVIAPVPAAVHQPIRHSPVVEPPTNIASNNSVKRNVPPPPPPAPVVSPVVEAPGPPTCIAIWDYPYTQVCSHVPSIFSANLRANVRAV